MYMINLLYTASAHLYKLNASFPFDSIINSLLVKRGSTAQNFIRQELLSYGIVNIS
ncbi:hypothetical protein T07_6261 [Trichinella nelsoni]|uniref:Uncharacterized protein n=1 Tax=Trichinella nelsoni TaxID=6336 RepID=A0A0V0RB57_9BILA|nr:hypothetical protein T07_6261 [Trichinella nelsoni]